MRPKHGNRVERFLALLLLSSCGGPEANPTGRDPYERYLAVREYGEARQAARAAEMLEDPHFLVVTGALEALAAIGDPAFLQHAASRVQHQHPMVRAQACATIAAIRNPEGLPALAICLKDADAGVRRAAVKALGAFGARPEARKALVETVGDADPSVALMAHEKLQDVTGRRDVERSAEAWTKALQP
jgi:HEAT repeat protein